MLPYRPTPLIAAACLALVLSACQAAQPTPSASSDASATAAATSEPTATPKPVSLPRPTDIPADGSCEQGHICLGLLTAGTVYTTSAFQPAITFSVPEAGWENRADEGGIFFLLRIAYPGDSIAFFRNPIASGVGASSVGTSIEELAAWAAANPLLDASPPTPVTIGGLQGLTMDMRVATGAENQDPGCPVQVCVPFLRGKDETTPSQPQWKWDWGFAGLETQRLYLLTSSRGVLAIFVDSYDGTSFDALTTAASAILATVTFE